MCSRGAQPSLTQSVAGIFPLTFVNRPLHKSAEVIRSAQFVGARDLTHAVASMASDLKAHPDTDNPALNGLVMIGMMYVTDGDKASVQRWIERFR